ncbi:carboxymuconolactone decarboxylase family protein [Nitrospinota bacterium]
MSRLPPLTLDQMTNEQRRVYDDIAQGPRGSVRGPFLALLRSPEATSRMQRVGEYLRFQSMLPARLRMLAVLVTARAWTAQYEWQVHVPQALQAGLDAGVIEEIATRKRPSSLKPDETIVYDFCSELQERKRVSDSAFRAALELLGEQGVVELTVLNGYFTAVAMTLNVFEVEVPDKSQPLLD